MRRSIWLLTCACLMIGATAVFAGPQGEESSADEWPSRPIEIVFPFRAGIPVHVHAQLTAQFLSEELGVEVTVPAMPGGGGAVAANHVLSQPADGYTIFDGWVAALVVQPVINPNVGYSASDFIPIGGHNANPWTLVVRNDHPANNLEEFMEWALANPGLRYNAAETGVDHAALAQFLLDYEVLAQNVPYDGLASAVPDLLSGDLDFGLLPPAMYMDTYRNEFRPLSVFLSERHPMAPDVPTATEQGFPPPFSDAIAAGWDFFVVREGTPAPIVERLREAMRNVMTNEEYLEESRRRFLTSRYVQPELFEETIRLGLDELRAGYDAIVLEDAQFE